MQEIERILTFGKIATHCMRLSSLLDGIADDEQVNFPYPCQINEEKQYDPSKIVLNSCIDEKRCIWFKF